jgi:hypothetical protein
MRVHGVKGILEDSQKNEYLPKGDFNEGQNRLPNLVPHIVDADDDINKIKSMVSDFYRNSSMNCKRNSFLATSCVFFLHFALFMWKIVL